MFWNWQEMTNQQEKFDLVEDKTGSCSITYTVDGESASAGSNVLIYGDTLKISVAPSTGYTITKLQVNGKDYVSGTEIFVDNDIKLEVLLHLHTTITPAEHSTISVKRRKKCRNWCLMETLWLFQPM